jgi:hypothetical protein
VADLLADFLECLLSITSRPSCPRSSVELPSRHRAQQHQLVYTVLAARGKRLHSPSSRRSARQ